MNKRKIRVFFDSSVLVSASISATGKSRYLLTLSSKNKIRGISSQYAILESKRAFSKKLPEALLIFQKIIQEANLEILDFPKDIAKYEKIIKDKGDAPILASAVEAKIDYLVTLNRKHFLNDKNLQSKVDFKIIKPEEFKFKSKFKN